MTRDIEALQREYADLSAEVLREFRQPRPDEAKLGRLQVREQQIVSEIKRRGASVRRPIDAPMLPEMGGSGARITD